MITAWVMICCAAFLCWPMAAKAERGGHRGALAGWLLLAFSLFVGAAGVALRAQGWF